MSPVPDPTQFSLGWCGSEGWQYAGDFASTLWGPEASRLCFVRKRRWLPTPVRCGVGPWSGSDGGQGRRRRGEGGGGGRAPRDGLRGSVVGTPFRGAAVHNWVYFSGTGMHIDRLGTTISTDFIRTHRISLPLYAGILQHSRTKKYLAIIHNSPLPTWNNF